MRTSYSMSYTPALSGNVIDLNEYRARKGCGLPPKPRRRHPKGPTLQTGDLVSMALTAMTFAATGMVLAGM